MGQNAIERAIRYIEEPEALLKTLDLSVKTKDLEVPSKFIGARSVRYQTIKFEDYNLGDFDREKGYGKKGTRLEWTEQTMTQDKGDSVYIDKMDDEEAMANGIVRIANRYIMQVQAPAVDKYRFATIAAATHSNVVVGTFTEANIIGKLLEGRKLLVNSHIVLDNTVLYLAASADTIRAGVAMNKGTLGLGNWNGNMEAKVNMFKESKIVVVPDDYLPSGVQAMLVNIDVAPAMKKYSECEYHNKIPGFGGRRAQADIGIYHDCFPYLELERGIVLFLEDTSTTFKVTYNKGDADGEETVPTQAAVKPGTVITLAAATLTYKGHTFVGWDDGANLYPAGAKYIVPNAAVTLTARWKAN